MSYIPGEKAIRPGLKHVDDSFDRQVLVLSTSDSNVVYAFVDPFGEIQTDRCFQSDLVRPNFGSLYGVGNRFPDSDDVWVHLVEKDTVIPEFLEREERGLKEWLTKQGARGLIGKF